MTIDPTDQELVAAWRKVKIEEKRLRAAVAAQLNTKATALALVIGTNRKREHVRNTTGGIRIIHIIGQSPATTSSSGWILGFARNDLCLFETQLFQSEQGEELELVTIGSMDIVGEFPLQIEWCFEKLEAALRAAPVSS